MTDPSKVPFVHKRETVNGAIAQARSHTEQHEHRMSALPLDERDDFTMPDFRTTAGYVYWLCDELTAFADLVEAWENAFHKIAEGREAMRHEGMVEAFRLLQAERGR